MQRSHLKHLAAALALCLPLMAFGAERLVVDIAVKGMTCPFCAYGLEKNLGKASEHASASARTSSIVRSGPTSHRTTDAHVCVRAPGRHRYQDQRGNGSPIRNTGVRCPATR